MTTPHALCRLSVLVVVLVNGTVLAQSIPAADFHSKVASLYSFQPHLIGKENFPAKSNDLDKFWSYAKANTNAVLPLLRQELSNPANPSFFFYDGAKLLLSLSKDKEDQALALRSMPKADLQDIQTSDYLTTIQWFASFGFDTRQAAFRILAYPEFTAFIPQHALTLGQDYSLIYMLFPLQNVPYDQDLIAHLSADLDSRSQKSLLLALWYVVTLSTRAAIQRFIEKPGVNPEVVTYARELLSRKAGPRLSLSSAESLRSERAKVMQRPISDEALIEFDSLTMKLLAKL